MSPRERASGVGAGPKPAGLAARSGFHADGPGMCTGAYPESGNRLHSGWESSVLTDDSWIGRQPVGTAQFAFGRGPIPQSIQAGCSCSEPPDSGAAFR